MHAPTLKCYKRRRKHIKKIIQKEKKKRDNAYKSNCYCGGNIQAGASFVRTINLICTSSCTSLKEIKQEKRDRNHLLKLPM
jgi:hypothetical protein